MKKEGYKRKTTFEKKKNRFRPGHWSTWFGRVIAWSVF